jgi:hypothetical protein
VEAIRGGFNCTAQLFSGAEGEKSAAHHQVSNKRDLLKAYVRN